MFATAPSFRFVDNTTSFIDHLSPEDEQLLVEIEAVHQSQTCLPRKRCREDTNNNIRVVRLCRSEREVTRVVKLRRRGGKIIQDCDIYIGRACYQGGWQLSQSKWHNPFSIQASGSAQRAVELYEKYLRSKPELLKDIPELAGKVLGCWCKEKGSEWCHGDVLVKLANERIHCLIET